MDNRINKCLDEVTHLLQENHIEHDEVLGPDEDFDDFDVYIACNELLDACKCVLIFSPGYWVKVEQDYDIIHIYLKKGGRSKEDAMIFSMTPKGNE